MHPANLLIQPGSFVRHPTEPSLGLGRVQTVVGDIITVNFEDAGKIVIDGDRVALDMVDPTKGG